MGKMVLVGLCEEKWTDIYTKPCPASLAMAFIKTREWKQAYTSWVSKCVLCIEWNICNHKYEVLINATTWMDL